MCVQTANKNWERPATLQDAKILENYFKGIDLVGIMNSMQQDGGVPLTTDLALVGAVLTIPENQYGIKYIPFTALNVSSKTCIKIPEMENIVDWMENTALGSHMWSMASKFIEMKYDRKIYFSMNCGCGAPTIAQFSDGTVSNWNRQINNLAKNVYGKTNILYSDDISDTNMSITERKMWSTIREALESLPNTSNEMTVSLILQNTHEENILR